MPKDSSNLLIIDHSPECAEEINSLLRNSGIIIRTIYAKTVADAESSIKSTYPFLLIYNANSKNSTPISKILQLADTYKLNAAVRCSTEETSKLTEAMSFHSFIAVNSEEDDHLVRLINSLLERGKDKSEFDEMSSRFDELQSRYQLLLDSSREATAYIHEGLHTYANRAYLELLQEKDFNTIKALSLLEIMRSKETNLKKLLRDMNQGDFPTNPIVVEINLSGRNVIEASLLFSPARYEKEDCIQMMVQEVDANAVLKDELDRLKRTDSVTKLANRLTFSEILSQHIEQDQGAKAISAIFYLEIDGSQGLHSTLGVSGWDRFMVEIANVIKASINEGDIASRFNDDGFALLAIRKNKSELQDFANHIVSNIANHPLELENRSFSATCSLGFTIVGSLTSSVDEVINHTLNAYEQAASEGNCAKQYKPASSATETTEDDQVWIERIRFALDNQEIYSVQQSIVNLEGDSEGLFENKTYIKDENQDLPAEQFMPIAERNDLGATIDRHVIQGLMQAISGTGDRHIISLTTNSLLDFSFTSWFIHQMEELGVQGSQIILQLSASSVEENLKPAIRLVEELKPYGCSIALSSFDDRRKICALLDHVDVSLVKLRPGLTEGLTNNSAHQQIVTKVVNAADKKQISVIADGIQDAADLAILWQCGVKLVAGDFLKESPQVVGQ